MSASAEKRSVVSAAVGRRERAVDKTHTASAKIIPDQVANHTGCQLWAGSSQRVICR